MRLLGSTIIAVAVAATFSLATASSTEAGATWRGVKSPMNAEHVGIIILPAARFSYQHNTGFAGRRTRDKGLLISSRMTGGPTGAVSQTAKQLASQVAASPMARYLITMAGFGGAGAAALSPTEVDEKSKDPRIQKLQDLDWEIADNRAKLEKQATTRFQSNLAREGAQKPLLDAIDAAGL